MDGHPCSLSLIQTVTRHRPVLRLVLHVTIAIVKSGCGREICSLPLRLQHGRAAASAPIVPVERGPRFPFRTVGLRRTRPLSGAARDNGAYARRQGKAVADCRSWRCPTAIWLTAVGMEPSVVFAGSATYDSVGDSAMWPEFRELFERARVRRTRPGGGREWFASAPESLCGPKLSRAPV
jgi:hypothetical protein